MIKIINKTGLSVDTKIMDGDVDLTKRIGISYGAVVRFEEGLVKMDCTISSVESEIEVQKARWFIKHPFKGGYETVAEIKFKDGSVVRFDENGKPSFVEGEPT